LHRLFLFERALIIDRIRKVKCDEGRPHCKRCISTGRRCDGYTGEPLSWLRRATRPEPHLETNFSRSTKEQQYLTFFQLYAAPEFAGCFDSGFWRFDVPQASHHHPAIQAATIGLGALYRKFVSSSQGNVSEIALDEYGHDALKHCNRAIQMIIQMPASPSGEEKITILTVCILFSCFANLEGNYELAMRHFRGGLTLLNQADIALPPQSGYCAKHSVTFGTLETVYSRLDLLARGIDYEQQLPFQAKRSKSSEVSLPPSASFKQACTAVGRTLDELLLFLQDVSNKSQEGEHIITTEKETRRLMCDLDHWEGVLCKSLPQEHAQLPPNQKKVLIWLKICRSEIRILRKFTSLRARLGHRVWGAMEREFQEVVELAGQLLEVESDTSMTPLHQAPHLWKSMSNEELSNLSTGLIPKPVVRRAFSSTFGPVTALWAPATRCRNPQIRRRAIALLLGYPRTEGFVDSTLSGRIALKCMLFEEKAAGKRRKEDGDLPSDARIEEISIFYIAPRSAEVEFKTLQQLQNSVSGETTRFKW
jgi:hypothetical protein